MYGNDTDSLALSDTQLAGKKRSRASTASEDNKPADSEKSRRTFNEKICRSNISAKKRKTRSKVVSGSETDFITDRFQLTSRYGEHNPYESGNRELPSAADKSRRGR